jgi:penicillin amidase
VKGRLKRIGRILAAGLGVLALALAGFGLWLNHALNESLAQLDGELTLDGLEAEVTIERDALGVPTIHGASRTDVARATGFLHAQERFFQMDLLRRQAAGELAELLGPAALTVDRRNRVHRFRALAAGHLERWAAGSRDLLTAYAAGANAGLAALGAVPPEYLALRTDPAPWLPEDTALVVLSMYMELQDQTGRRESSLGLMADLLPPPLVTFLTGAGTEWDAPITGGPIATPALPEAAALDLRSPPAEAASLLREPPSIPGSNGWAIGGSATTDGRALLANDMHLPHGLPNVWYRLSFVLDGLRVTGVTLPGAPPMIVGSNGHVAWGFTNSQIDLSDLVVLEPHGDDGDSYLTPDGPRAIETIEERIAVKGGGDELLEVEWTVWGPVIDRDHRQRRRALRWVAHDPSGVDMSLVRMEAARDLDEALDIATRARIPTQNVQVADRDGRIGWTLMGPLPRRAGHDGRLPRSWADGRAGWSGYFAPEDYPRVVDPPSGRIWTANNRVAEAGLLDGIGDGGFALGARAQQIRDGLFAIERASEQSMLDVQLDDRALFLERWRELLLATVDGDERYAELRRLVADDWSGRASIESAGFRLVRAFRLTTIEQVFDYLTVACREADDRYSYWTLHQLEGPLWQLVTQRPAHLLAPQHESWTALLRAAVDDVLQLFPTDEIPLAERTWGARNLVGAAHPLSLAVPQLSRWLDIPRRPLPGDGSMPRVQNPRFGASMRMAVAPGREEQGLFHMPGGQSGHPRSPHYTAGHEAWETGAATPFLPGPTRHTLILRP